MIWIILSLFGHWVGIRCLSQYTQPIRDDGPKQHEVKAQTPTMGGVVILLGAILQLWLLDLLLHPISQALLGFGLIGLYDDIKKLYFKNSKGMRAKSKFLLQMLMAIIIILQLPKDSHMHILFQTYDIGILYVFFASIVITATSNAYNLTDGVDGLAASQGIILLVLFGTVAMMSHQADLVALSKVLIVMLMGFLWFNRYPARLFMGDVGSLAIGAALGVFSVMLKMEFLFALCASVLVFETLSVILQVAFFKMGYGRIFKMAPFHHHLELSGWRETQIVTVFAIVTMIMVLFGIYVYGV